MTAPVRIELEAKSRGSRARAGWLRTPRGSFETPIFMPVGTQASVKGLAPEELAGLGARVVLANTYHLFLRPGADVVEAAGGLHGFMAWPHAVLTDSGGFQVFSLSDLRDISEEGVVFRSHLDGSRRQLTPETVTRLQNQLGADIIMAFDECPPAGADRGYLERSVRRTARWAERCLAAHARPEAQALFGIVQGGTDRELRRESAERTTALDFPGYALGGLSVGEPHQAMLETLEFTVPLLPEDRPRYLMGVGAPIDLVESVERGIDMFDCVLPTRLGRHGHAWVGLDTAEREGLPARINLYNAAYQRDLRPIDPDCACPACSKYSRAYLRHLLVSGEALGGRLVSLHNLHHLFELLRRARAEILAGRYDAFASAFAGRWSRATQRGAGTASAPGFGDARLPERAGGAADAPVEVANENEPS